MRNKSERKPTYESKLKGYYNSLRIRERAGTLPPPFNASMDRFLTELKELIVTEQGGRLPRAA